MGNLIQKGSKRSGNQNHRFESTRKFYVCHPLDPGPPACGQIAGPAEEEKENRWCYGKRVLAERGTVRDYVAIRAETSRLEVVSKAIDC